MFCQITAGRIGHKLLLFQLQSDHNNEVLLTIQKEKKDVEKAAELLKKSFCVLYFLLQNISKLVDFN